MSENEPIKELTYNTLVRPQVEYASSVWSPHTKQNISKIEMVQRRTTRWVKNNYSPYESVSSMLDDLSWRSLANRRTDARLIMFYRIVYGYLAIQVPPYLEKSQRYTRHMHPLAFRQIHNSATYYQQSVYPSTTVLWNKLQRLSLSVILTPSRKESGQSLIICPKILNTVFNLLLTSLHSALTSILFLSYLTIALFMSSAILLLFLH